jgi:hypothetical protein
MACRPRISPPLSGKARHPLQSSAYPPGRTKRRLLHFRDVRSWHFCDMAGDASEARY